MSASLTAFENHLPRRVITGRRASQSLVSLCQAYGWQRVFVVSDAGVAGAGLLWSVTGPLSEAQLLLLQARNDQAAAFAALAAALGQPDAPAYALVDEPLPPAPPADEAALVAQALRERPDVAAERLVRESAAKFADAT